MIKLPHTQEMVKEAKRWATKLGTLNNSITSGRGNAAGRVGELALSTYLSVETPSDKYNHDINRNGETIEVKTKRRIVKPKSHYDVSVAKTSNHQKPDRYAFISLQFKKSDYFATRKQKFVASSCQATLVKLNKRIPKSWSAKCSGDFRNRSDTLYVVINYQIKNPPKENKKYKILLYRELANFLFSVASKSPNDNLEQISVVKIHIKTEKAELIASTKGKYLSKIITIKSTQILKEHLKTTVNIDREKFFK